MSKPHGVSMRSPNWEWSVLAKIKRKKSLHVGFWITPEQKKAVDTLAIELGLDISELMEMAIVQVYERLGEGVTPKFRALAGDDAIWREISAKSRERAEEERKSIRGRQ